MRKPPIWARAPYLLLGTRVPARYLEWVEQDVARPRWHVWVPRLRIWAPGLIVTWTWWLLAGRDGLLLPVAATVVLTAIWLMPAGTGETERRDEVLFQRRKLSTANRLTSYLSFFEMIQPPDEGSKAALPPLFDHEAAVLDDVDAAVLSAPCAVCAQTIQREGEGWAHRDPDWLLYSCPACGWQDAAAMRCPDCATADLVRHEPEPVPPARRLSAFRVYVALLAIAIVAVLFTDERSPLARLVR